MAEWSKAPDSRHILTLHQCLVFWSTNVGANFFLMNNSWFSILKYYSSLVISKILKIKFY